MFNFYPYFLAIPIQGNAYSSSGMMYYTTPCFMFNAIGSTVVNEIPYVQNYGNFLSPFYYVSMATRHSNNTISWNVVSIEGIGSADAGSIQYNSPYFTYNYVCLG